jgi:uncharacterized protein (DUF1778 family)
MVSTRRVARFDGWCHNGTMGSNAAKTRLVARIPAHTRRTIQAAATLQGTSLNHFVVQAAWHQAQDVLDRESLLRLNRAQASRVIELLDHPPKPNAALRAAKALHRARVRA